MKLLNRTRLVRPSSVDSTWKFLLTGVLTVSLSVLLASPVYAQDDDKERKTKQTVAMSQPVYEALMEIQELVEAEDFVTAQEKIRELQGKKKLSTYESAQIWNLSGYSYDLQENYDAAISSYENVLRQPELPVALQQSTLKTLAQYNINLENCRNAHDSDGQHISYQQHPAHENRMHIANA